MRQRTLQKVSIIGVVTLLAILAVATAVLVNQRPASGLSGSEFNAGRIIDDGIFYNQSAMDVATIQAFLQSKVPTCDTSGSQRASEFGRSDITRAQYAASVGWHGPPYTCLKDYRQNTPQVEAASGLCNGIPAKSNQSAAQIIYDIMQACHINPQVFLVLLQKEQSLITDTWPLNNQHVKAVGYGCPDSNLGTDVDANQNGCFDWAEGFFNQIYYGARQYQIYRNNPNNYVYRAGQTNTVRYNPNVDCGSSQLYIENQATAGLYIYTPYQPNGAALNNLYGTGDGCSAYGNRNFWRLFNDWFGSTRLSYEPLTSPTARWMVVTTNTHKKVPGTNADTLDPNDTTITAGTQLFFVDKVYLDNQWYLRTARDRDLNLAKGIPLSALGDIQYQAVSTVEWMNLTRNSRWVNPVTGQEIATAPAGRQIQVADKILVNGVWYYRSVYDRDSGNNAAVLASDIGPITYSSHENSRWVRTARNTNKVNPVIGQVGTSIASGTELYINSKIFVKDKWYYRTSADTTSNTPTAIPEDNIQEIPYSGFTPRWEKLTTNSTKLNPLNGTFTNESFSTNTQLFIAEEITVNGTRYYRTVYDRDHGNNKTIPASNFTTIEFEPVATSRVLRVKQNVSKLNPITGESANDVQPAGREIMFSSKIYVNGIWYFRTQLNTNANQPLAIPYDSLQEL